MVDPARNKGVSLAVFGEPGYGERVGDKVAGREPGQVVDVQTIENFLVRGPFTYLLVVEQVPLGICAALGKVEESHG
jgi:hypothetical protein